MSLNIKNEQLRIALAQLDELTDWERRSRGSMRVDFQPMLDLAYRLGDPHRSFRCVHVAGTKGKGSTCSLIAAGLSRAGIRVGRYASPHVVHISERITLDGRPIGESGLADALTAALGAFKDAQRDDTRGRDATWFDLLTVSAFVAFRKEGVEWAVVEAGIGGRLDSTNIVESEVAVITNIELEHTEVLGFTRTAIAFEKAGIIKAGATVITPLSEDDEAGSMIASRALELRCEVNRPTIFPDETLESRNIAVAGAALDAVGAKQLNASTGVVNPVGAWLLDERTTHAARLPGRLDVRNVTVATSFGDVDVRIVFDGAHVPFNLYAVLSDLSKRSEFQRHCFVIMSVAEDKDAMGLLSVMNPATVSILFAQAGPRSRNPDQLKELANIGGYQSDVIYDPKLAYQKALQSAATENGWVLVTGSLYLVGNLIDSGEKSP